MPEGPEVWILSKSINLFYNNENTLSKGKHLIIKDKRQSWSFGLNGKVAISIYGSELVKLESGWIHGEQTDYNIENDKLGIDWINASQDELENEVNKWIKSKKKLAALMLDQSKICGIGVAWGSEILYHANLNPDIKACEQSLDKLVSSMIEIRTKIKETYEDELNKLIQVCAIYGNNQKLKEFINCWFENLYELRKMNIYKRGKKVDVSGRSWWIKRDNEYL